jgi:hypothetical protein
MESSHEQVQTKHGPLWVRVWQLQDGYAGALDIVRHPNIRVSRPPEREPLAASRDEALQRLVRDINREA